MKAKTKAKSVRACHPGDRRLGAGAVKSRLFCAVASPLLLAMLLAACGGGASVADSDVSPPQDDTPPPSVSPPQDNAPPPSRATPLADEPIVAIADHGAIQPGMLTSVGIRLVHQEPDIRPFDLVHNERISSFHYPDYLSGGMKNPEDRGAEAFVTVKSPEVFYCLATGTGPVSYKGSPCRESALTMTIRSDVAGGRYSIRYRTLRTHGQMVAGVFANLRPNARIWYLNLGYEPKTYEDIGAYNRWAMANGREKISVYSNSWASQEWGDPPFSTVMGEELLKPEHAESLFVAGNGNRPPVPPNPRAVLLNERFRVLHERYISVAGVILTVLRKDVPHSEDEKYAIFDEEFAHCGEVAESCLAALSHGAPVTAYRGWLIYPQYKRPDIASATLEISYGDQRAEAAFPDSADDPEDDEYIYILGPSYLGGGTSAATPRVAAAAIGVMRESGMTDGATAQKVIFKTAFKCRKDGEENKVSATRFAADATLAELLVADCKGDGSLESNAEYLGYKPIDTERAGQGFLNYIGATVEAAGIRLTDAAGQAAGRLREAAFNAPPIFGDGVAHQLAAIDLDLIGPSGNHYRHRPWVGSLRPNSFAFDDAERVFAFGKRRIKPPARMASGAQMFAHSETPFLLDAESGAMSGFSYRTPIASGVFNFSYDDEMLPSRFNAQTTLLPEANISPYLDFTRKGMELSFQSGGLFAAADGGVGASHGVGFAADDGGAFSFTAAQGGREDEYGEEAEAIIGMASYRKRISDVQIDLSLGALQERDRLLGAKTGGAFATAEALTRFAGIKAEWTPQSGEGFADDGNADLTFFASVWRGETSAQPGAGAIFKRRLDIGSESYALGMTKPRLFHRNDEMTFTVFHPLRAYRAKAHLALPLDRGGEVQRDNLDLAARAREFDFSIAYRRAFGDDGRFTIGALYRHNPAHRDDAKAERIAAFSLGLEW